MFTDFKLMDDRPVSIQVKDYMKRLITKGGLQSNQRLPSTRELSSLLNVSRNTVVMAYSDLEEEGLIYVLKGKGNYVAQAAGSVADAGQRWQVDWKQQMNDHARIAEEQDLMKRGIRSSQGMISFTSIAPDEKLFDIDNFRRAFLDRMSLEGEVLLNYGYAKGYKPLIDYLMHDMENKGVDMAGKDILITNGFTEGLDILLSVLTKNSGRILCENPTHHTAIKNFKLHGFSITGIDMEAGGISLQKLEQALSRERYDLAYLVPSYQNPTGIVMSPEKRRAVIELMSRHQVPILEDGFNEELRYSGAHVAPLIASGGGNSIVYVGSYSKILFPGLRVGWVLADKELIDYLVSVKRARSIHTSTLDQSVLYQYLHNGYFEKYLKRAKSEYKRKYELAVQCCQADIPFRDLSGDGGLHLFLAFENGFDTRQLLNICRERGVIFTPGTIFYTDGGGGNTMRLGFSRVADADIVKGIGIIGQAVKEQM
ncbi:PLP-dependent aminotransferase family protein [Paenibacillus oenotherae]|uniref:PLP-dependent aminotransferase family protein n=1 Tax=Paenibacillus oenotherae TaxID=1435645 RepID=A0ABS7D956_9BACL|nr:PLP-dependent aminotransferase family protein [Paenibacillus oenotherae]MBW7476381.1 PLP-dependent aminotransferase family protein [Paenibacillus oenotherae]